MANGFALAPGFIDTHTHDDRALLSEPLMECKISQGVTTVITGNCGISLAPLSIVELPAASARHHRPPGVNSSLPRFDEYLWALDRDPPALNAACQVGHTTLRAGAMAQLDRVCHRRPEIATMRRTLGIVAEARCNWHVHGNSLFAGQGGTDRRGD